MKIMHGLGVAIAVSAVSLTAYGQLNRKASPVADAEGHLHVPADYRATYQALGIWAVAADQGQGLKQLHVVYASPGTVDAYLRDGHFQDGSVLVKEVFSTATGSMTTGTVSRAQTLEGWFVMVKEQEQPPRQ